MRRHLKAAALAAFLLCGTVPAGAQCPMCRTALQSPEAAGLARAFRGAILVLLAAPFLSVGGVAYLVIRSRRDEEGGAAPARYDGSSSESLPTCPTSSSATLSPTVPGPSGSRGS